MNLTFPTRTDATFIGTVGVDQVVNLSALVCELQTASARRCCGHSTRPSAAAW